MDRRSGTDTIAHSDTVVCSNCGKSGTIFWDHVSRASQRSAREFAGIDGPFFERLGKKPPDPIELVCSACGGVAMTAFPSTALHDRSEYH